MNFQSLQNPESFYERVWALVRQVPSGLVVTYGQVAQLVEPPAEVAAEAYKAFGARWVGNAMAACPADVPWQRVINAQGKISQRAGAERQRILLEAEGILLVKDRVNLKQYQWGGPGSVDVGRQMSLF